MAIKIYNTLTRKKEIFKPRQNRKVNLFVCGPTVYDFSHLGHARTYLLFDMIVKYLKVKGFEVFYLQNITDIDDKIIDRAKREGRFWKNLSRKFEREYLKDMKKLNINSISKYARATDHIKEIINQVERLLKKGFAYRSKDGIYYDISKFKNYGRLSGRTFLQAEDAVSRIDESNTKRNRGDFCLWKFSKPKEPKWQSPWGWGRPGWHIEDTAITEKYFGPQYDIHGGGRDLIFPHHEAEIAQMEAISGKRPMVKYWLHTGFLTVNKEKMAKSLGNFVTVRDFLHQNSPRILRYFFLKSHYRSPIDFNENLIKQAEKELKRIDEFVEKLKSQIATNKTANSPNNMSKIRLQIRQYSQAFDKAMEDDFNTPRALGIIFKLINQGNTLLDKEKIGKKEAKTILDFFAKIDKFLNFIFGPQKKEEIPQQILSLAKQREKFRQEKNWQKADKIREKIKKLGFLLEDTPKGVRIKKI